MSEIIKEKDKEKRIPPHAWKAGQSGNPKGRPKKSNSLTEELRAMSNRQTIIEDENGETKKVLRKIALARKIWQEAIAGNFKYVEMLLNRIDGKMADTVILDNVIEHLPDQERSALLNKFKVDKRKRQQESKAKDVEEQILKEEAEIAEPEDTDVIDFSLQ